MGSTLVSYSESPRFISWPGEQISLQMISLFSSVPTDICLGSSWDLSHYHFLPFASNYSLIIVPVDTVLFELLISHK
jgi:hypothetical protein